MRGREKKMELWSEFDTGGNTMQEVGLMWEGTKARSIVEGVPVGEW